MELDSTKDKVSVYIPSPLRSYTMGEKEVQVNGGEKVIDIINNLNGQFKGIKFRMVTENDTLREHMRVFVGKEEIKTLQDRMDTDKKLFIFQALTGGILE